MTTPVPGDAAALRPVPRTITLRDGQQIPVEFTMESLWLIEERYGSIGAYRDSLEAMTAGDEGDLPNRQVFIPLVKALACVVPVEELQDPRVLVRHLGIDQFTETATTLMLALQEALTTGDQDGRPNPQETPATTTAGSPGGSFTTSAPSPSPVLTLPSGV